MHPAKFFLDECSLAHEIGKSEPSIDLLGDIITTVEDILKASQVCEIYCAKHFYSISINGSIISDVLSGEKYRGEYRDIFTRIIIAMERCIECTDEDNRKISSFLGLIKTKSGGWVSFSNPNKMPGWNANSMAWLLEDGTLKIALRKLYNYYKHPRGLIDQYSKFLFPNIYFHAKASEFNKTNLDYESTLEKYLNHLSFLNDDAANLFATCDSHEIKKRASASDIDMSPESPNTHKNQNAMNKRYVKIAGEDICCEWHTKLSYNRGRIHFYALADRPKSVSDITGSKVIVGKIVDHLP